VKLISPATIFDLGEVKPQTDHLTWTMLRLQLQEGQSFVVRTDQGKAVVVGGFIALLEQGSGEAWFCPAPNLKRSEVLAAVRAVVMTMKLSGYVALRVVTTTHEGSRIAKLAGFELYDTAPDGTEVWIWLIQSK
jgi:hypothetical protein